MNAQENRGDIQLSRPGLLEWRNSLTDLPQRAGVTFVGTLMAISLSIRRAQARTCAGRTRLERQAIAPCSNGMS
jgi:hypothetical protein